MSHPVKEGVYLIEMAFDRPVEPKLLETVLERAGFSDIVFDQAKGGAVFGALPKLSPRVAPAAPKPAPAPGAPRAVAPAPRPGAIRPIARTPLAAPTVSTATMRRVAPDTAPSPRPGLSMSRPGLSVPGRAAVALRTPLVTRAVAAPPKRPRLTLEPGGAPAEAMPAESAPAPVPAAEDGGGGGGGGFSPSPGGEETEALPGDGAEAETEASAAPGEPAPAEVHPVERWRRWREWGSPYSEGPRVSGAGAPTEARVRFLARLRRPVMVQNKPGMSWLSIVPLAVDPYAPCLFTLSTKSLETGRTYDVRFFSRDKKAPRREDVARGLEGMGFDMDKLIAMRRNVTLPGRPGGGLTLWVGRGTWLRPDSLIVAEDPFFFEDAKPIA